MVGSALFEKILLHVEATERSLAAARYAIVLAKTCGASLHAVYVINEQVLEELFRAKVFLAEEGVDLARDLEADGKRYLAFVARLAAQKDVPLTTELLKGIVHEQVVEKAREMEANLLVLGEIEESVSRRDCFYNESERILSTARCPVLVVKGDEAIRNVYDAL